MTVIRKCSSEALLDCLTVLETMQGNDASRVEIDFRNQRTVFTFATAPPHIITIQLDIVGSLDISKLVQLLGPRGLNYLPEHQLVETFDTYDAQVMLSRAAAQPGRATVDTDMSW